MISIYSTKNGEIVGDPRPPDIFDILFVASIDKNTFKYDKDDVTYRSRSSPNGPLDRLYKLQKYGMFVYGRVRGSEFVIRLKLVKE